MIYLGNAATSFPKPASCFQESLDTFLAAGASPGRGGYDAALEAEQEVAAVRRAGWLITGKTVWTKADEPMQFLTFEDETGLVETAFFSRAYRRFAMMLDWSRPYPLEGLVEDNFGVATLEVVGCRKL